MCVLLYLLVFKLMVNISHMCLCICVSIWVCTLCIITSACAFVLCMCLCMCAIDSSIFKIHEDLSLRMIRKIRMVSIKLKVFSCSTKTKWSPYPFLVTGILWLVKGSQSVNAFSCTLCVTVNWEKVTFVVHGSKCQIIHSCDCELTPPPSLA